MTTPRLLLVQSTLGDYAKGRLLLSPWSAFRGVFPMHGTYFAQNLDRPNFGRLWAHALAHASCDSNQLDWRVRRSVEAENLERLKFSIKNQRFDFTFGHIFEKKIHFCLKNP